jgi:ribose 5-phosphate isomerase RpiB
VKKEEVKKEEVKKEEVKKEEVKKDLSAIVDNNTKTWWQKKYLGISVTKWGVGLLVAATVVGGAYYGIHLWNTKSSTSTSTSTNTNTNTNIPDGE